MDHHDSIRRLRTYQQTRQKRYPILNHQLISHNLHQLLGHTPSQIGVMLRDSHGIPQVAHLTGKKILRILKKSGKL